MSGRDLAAERAAELRLEAELAAYLPAPGYGYAPGRHLVRNRHALDDRVLSALAHLGALTEAAAHDWSARAEQVRVLARRRGLRRDPELRSRAKELLERMLGDVEPLVERRGSTGWVTMPYDEFGGALEAIDALRLLDARQRERWSERWFRALDEGRADSPPAREPEPEDPYAAVDLLAVVPPLELETDAPVRVTCAELYADCVAIAWQTVVPQEEWGPGEEQRDVLNRRVSRTFGRLDAVAITLTDDVGTTYRPVGPQSQHGGIEAARSTAAWSETVFVPAVPEGAGRLEAALRPGDATTVFELPG